MLIQLSVANFRSIKDEQVFSMVASNNRELLDSNTFDAPLADKSRLKLLPAAAIYGPNAAGKTNLLVALGTIQKIVLISASEKVRGEPIPVAPFKLDPETRNAPSKFEIMFIVEGVRYQYGFSAIPQRVIDEWLYAYPGSRAQRWFTRTWENNEYRWHFGTRLTGAKNLWQQATRENALFLSTAVQLNSKQLQPVYDWFGKTLQLVDPDQLSGGISAERCENENENNKDREDIIGFLRAADLGIDNIHVKKESLNPAKMPADMPDEIKQFLFKEGGDMNFYEVISVHRDSHGKPVAFDMDDESQGTQRIFALAAPWVESLKNGYVLCIDELHNSLHPTLFKFLVHLFNNPNANLSHAQLIFTTHETSVLNQQILRRDQIWFCEKDETQATQVTPLTDFHPRKGRENLETAYMSGRYGAVPYIREDRV